MSTAAVTTPPHRLRRKASRLSPQPGAKAKAPVLMEVVVNRDVLLPSRAAQGITSSRTTIPILSNLLIEAQDASQISASNIEQTLTTKAPAT